MIIESLLIKGGLTLFKVLASKGAVAKAATVAVKTSISHYGVATTVSGISTLCIGTGAVIWIKERAGQLRSISVALEAGDYSQALVEGGNLIQAVSEVSDLQSYGSILGDFLDSGGDASKGKALLDATRELIEVAREG